MALHSGREFIELYDDTIIKISGHLRSEIVKHTLYKESTKLQLLKNMLSLNKNINQLVCDYAIALKWRCLFSDSSLIDSIDFTSELRDLYLEYNDNAFVTETYRFVIQSFIEQIVILMKQQNFLDEVDWEIFSAMSKLENYHKEYIENIKWWNAKIKYEYLEWLIFIYSEGDFSATVKSVVKNMSKSTDINFTFEASESKITLEVLEALRETTQLDLIDSYTQRYFSM